MQLVRLANAHQPTTRKQQVQVRHSITLQWTDDKSIDFVNTLKDDSHITVIL